ncbi:protein-tyrosine phosphatase [Angomonas deanei]|uniref:protein-tyrosine-phosphatase n=1 Tax=Angomonas deanei TaxID=59799 RepID=A0A7G2C866_9TRYP|nr:protein-tyrosine phosphatase [Angomonas deanei]CAD2214997.1 Protein tyrosine kinase/Protein kinase domain/Dual specificity phosphatase, catalytic domain containing protein, putative [Angomonas deanei]|eukprot:EPY30596.1 protein-tyrosine phosphatase [Angomonas deanei]
MGNAAFGCLAKSDVTSRGSVRTPAPYPENHTAHSSSILSQLHRQERAAAAANGDQTQPEPQQVQLSSRANSIRAVQPIDGTAPRPPQPSVQVNCFTASVKGEDGLPTSFIVQDSSYLGANGVNGFIQNLNDEFNESLRCYGGDKGSRSSRTLSPRAQQTVHFVNEIFRRCGGEEPVKPDEPPVTNEERIMFDIFRSLLHSPIGRFFVDYPEVIMSNRCCVLTAPDFGLEEAVEQFRVRYVFRPGTIGRSYVAVRDKTLEAPSEPGSRPGSSRSRKGGNSLDNVQVATVKAVSFILRQVGLDEIITEQRVLVNLNNEHVLKIHDVLNDEFHENMIVISQCMREGNITSLAGTFDDSPERLRKIISDVTEGLRVLHTHNIYHHNLKLENVFHAGNDTYCVADAGFSKIFTSQCPEQLVFNGEIACIPPEVFDENSRYSCGEQMIPVGESNSNGYSSTTLGADGPNGISREMKAANNDLGKVDVWGLGILMYRLAYGKSPFSVGVSNYEAVRDLILTWKLNSPRRIGPFAADLEDAISWCVEKDPKKRPTILKLLRHSFFSSNQFLSPQTGRLHSIRSNSFFVSSSSLGSKNKPSKNGYAFEGALGTGRWSEALLTKRRSTSKYCVFKIVKKTLRSRLTDLSEKQANEFRRQIAVCLKIEHPNLVPYTEIIDGRKGCFVVEDYIQSDKIKEIPFALDDATNQKDNLLSCLFQILNGLYALHINGLSHLSLSPNNIFYDSETEAYKLTDFGPVFLTERELTAKPSIYALPDWITSKDKVSGVNVDTYCVGLLTVSAFMKETEKLWLDFYSGNAIADPKELLEHLKVAEKSPHYANLVDLTEICLTREITAKKLMRHALFSNLTFNVDISKKKVEVTEEEIQKAITTDLNRNRGDSRIMGLVGHDSTFESGFDDDDMPDASVSCFEKLERFHEFSGKCMTCKVCKTEMPCVTYCCTECVDFLRCGKCAVNNDHLHELFPYYLVSVTPIEGGMNRATLLPITTVKTLHEVETMEMNSNFPVGVLTSYWRQYSTINSLGKTFPSLGVDSDDEISRCSSNPLIGSTLNFGTRIQSIDGMSPKSSHLNSSGSGFNLPSASGSKAGLLSRFKSGKGDLKAGFNKNKITLPKEGEIDDMTVEQAIEHVREENADELVLVNKKLIEVPQDIYNPPLLSLVYLSLSHNELVTLPHQIGLLKNLKNFVVSENLLEEVPESIGNLTQLERFDASHNCLVELPQNFVYLSNLQSISLDFNLFTEFPPVLFNIMSSEISLAEIEKTLEDRKNSGQMVTMSPLKTIYLSSNDNLSTFPDVEQMKCFNDLLLILDNMPSIYTFYTKNNLEEKLPNVKVSWNKRYPDEIIKDLYCGALRSAQSQLVYEKLNIKYLLTVGRDLTPLPPEGGKHKVIVVDDIPGADIRSSFQEAVDFIDESLRRNCGCLVHCFAGMSRSATTVIAYLMIKRKMRMDDAYLLTKKGRPAITPNKSFVEQLILLDEELFGKNVRPLDLQALGRGDDKEDEIKQGLDSKIASKKKEKKSALKDHLSNRKSEADEAAEKKLLEKKEATRAAELLTRMQKGSTLKKLKEESESGPKSTAPLPSTTSLPPPPARILNGGSKASLSRNGREGIAPAEKPSDSSKDSPTPSVPVSKETSISVNASVSRETLGDDKHVEESVVLKVNGEEDLDFSSVKAKVKPTSAPATKKKAETVKKFVPKRKGHTPTRPSFDESSTSPSPSR